MLNDLLPSYSPNSHLCPADSRIYVSALDPSLVLSASVTKRLMGFNAWMLPQESESQ